MDPKEGRVPKFENLSIRVVPARSCTSCQLSRHWVVSRFICLYMSHFHCDLMNLVSACSYLPCIWIRSNLEIFKRATTNIQSFWLGRYLALACSTFWGRGQQAMESSSLWAHCPNLGSSARTSICIAETCNFLRGAEGGNHSFETKLCLYLHLHYQTRSAWGQPLPDSSWPAKPQRSTSWLPPHKKTQKPACVSSVSFWRQASVSSLRQVSAPASKALIWDSTNASWSA